MEISRRAAVLTLHGSSHVDSDGVSIQRKTRYSYYRKAKVLEYYNFINNLFAFNDNISSVTDYDFNQQYFLIGNSTTYASPLIKNQVGNGYDIDGNVIEYAAETLKNVVCYITELREKIKLQTRKNYMRGTSMLLKYVVNQYLVDYAKTANIFNTQSETEIYNILSVIRTRLRQHSSNNIELIEYWDETEYFNISAATDKTSVNGNDTNQRYWEENQNSETFSDDDFYNFYLKDIGLKDSEIISDRVELDKFLATIFNLGAKSTNIDKSTGIFSAKMTDGIDSVDVYGQLTSLQYHYDAFTKYISGGEYSYKDGTISNQISNVLDFISA